MKIVITGGSGMVGSSIKHVIQLTKDYVDYNDKDFIFLSSKDLDLTDRKRTLDFFMQAQPDYCLLYTSPSPRD